MSPSPIRIRLGQRARRRIAAAGAQAADIALVPAAAGGPKGLILHHFDCWLFGTWLARAPRPRRLVGASIGAWRMAAAAFDDPVAAHRRLARLYVGQRFPVKIDAAYVSRSCRALLDEVLDGRAGEALAHPDYRLSVLAARGIGALQRSGKWREIAGFLLAAANNAAARARLAGSLERVVFHDGRDDAAWLKTHFADYIVPGWLDKAMPWRRAQGAALDNVILVSPSPEFLRTLPNGKMPDRRDFKFYGQDHAARARDWQRSIDEGERLAEAFARWRERPDLDLVEDF